MTVEIALSLSVTVWHLCGNCVVKWQRMYFGPQNNGKQAKFDQLLPQTAMNHNKGTYWVNGEVTVVCNFWKQY